MNWQIIPMENSHMTEVLEIEKMAFPNALWPSSLFFCEINLNSCGKYFVAIEDKTSILKFNEKDDVDTLLKNTFKDASKVIGYAGMWVKMRQSHITTLAVHTNYRRMGIGLSLGIKLIKESIKEKAGHCILEVKKSNIEAIKLYEKLGFKEIGIRKNYYIEDGDDGLVMFLEQLKGKKVKDIIEKYEQKTRGEKED